MTQAFKSVIRNVNFHVPEKVVTNDDLSKVMDTSDAWITERSGIKERRYAERGHGTSKLGTEAAQKVLAQAGLKASDVDLIIAATLSPDFYFPGIGALIQNNLGGGFTPALDIRAQCSGFVYGLATADAFIRSGMYKRILVVGAEQHSSVLDLTTRGREVGVLFGDGAGAAIVEAEAIASEAQRPSAQNKERGIIDSVMGGDGSGAEILSIKNPGTNNPHFITHQDIEEGKHYPKMEGRIVFKNAVTRMCESAERMLDKHRITANDISLLVPHQANLRISEMVREKLGLAPEKVFNNIHKYGNTTAATIPICLTEAEAQGKLKKGDLVFTVAFGAGFTWGANLIRW